MKKEDNKTKISCNFGCTIPIVALLCLLAVLELIKWKTALVIGLCILILPMAIWLLVVGIVAIIGSGVGIMALIDKIKRK